MVVCGELCYSVSNLTVSIHRRHTTLKPKAQAPFPSQFLPPAWLHSLLSRELDWVVFKESKSLSGIAPEPQVNPKLSVSASSPLGSILAPLSFPARQVWFPRKFSQWQNEGRGSEEMCLLSSWAPQIHDTTFLCFDFFIPRKDWGRLGGESWPW